MKMIFKKFKTYCKTKWSRIN